MEYANSMSVTSYMPHDPNTLKAGVFSSLKMFLMPNDCKSKKSRLWQCNLTIYDVGDISVVGPIEHERINNIITRSRSDIV